MGIDPGSLLAGRYRTGAVLGSGGAATVYTAHDELLGRDVAVKVWPTEQAWVDETRVTAQLHHPGVVVVHDGGVTGDAAYLVMELVDGPSLAQVLKDGALPRARATRIVSQLAQTLALVHADGIVHGDVKPANVLLAAGDRVVLADFGVAQPSRSRPTDLVVGTPQYLSPEQVRGEPVTAATDVYATGLVLLECLSGRTGYPGPAVAAAGARLRGEPQGLDSIPVDLATLIREMTADDPRRRPTAADVAARLAPGTANDTMMLPVVVRPPRARVALAAAGTLLALLAALAVAGPGKDGPAPPARPTPSRTIAPASLPTQPTRPSPMPLAHAHGRGHHHKHH